MSDPRTEHHERCRAVTLCCIDYRFVTALQGFLAERGLEGASDVIAWPGGALRVADAEDRPLMEVLSLASSLHRPEQLILAAHQDCAWIGGSAQFADFEAERSFLDGALASAGIALSNHFPELEVVRLRMGFEGVKVVP